MMRNWGNVYSLIPLTVVIVLMLGFGYLVFQNQRLQSQNQQELDVLRELLAIPATRTKQAEQPTQESPDASQPVVSAPTPHAEAIGKIESDAGMPLSRIAKLIIRDEGKRNRPYPDTGGVPTIGVGRNLRGNGLSVTELHAIVNAIDYRFLMTHTHIQNGRVRIPTLDLANQIFTKPLTADDIQLLLTDDLNNVRKEAVAVFGQAIWDNIPEPRKEAILDVVFNLGLPHFKAFVNFIGAVKAGDWQKASTELLLSDAARKNVLRYHRNATVIQTGDAKYFGL